ncbi:MAG TPA: maltose alpha-D-glucosyltransferase [Acidimicrobiia bacterium]|nr:maltose alpha-D-glucosyltransferase [Acidimicrobiia bacterium]
MVRTHDWYKDAVFYEVPIRSFCDGDGDGFGDFDGLISKLDYIADLGVTAVWVLPFYPSPLRDDGYDIADYHSVDPRYGGMEDFRRFVTEAHERNLKVVTELVINHTSVDHAWFQRARMAPKGSNERNFYVWSDTADRFPDARIIFTFTEDSNWAWDETAGAFYWHRFFSHQPDLNYDNPAVHAAVFEILDYWLSMGVDGLRLDAVPYLYVRDGTNGENLPETHAFLKKLRSYVDERHPGTMLLAEANQWPEDAVAYFGDGDESHMNYHFPLMPRLFMAVALGDRKPVREILAGTPALPDGAQWGIFVRNHDELTLEMVTDQERALMLETYAKDPRAPMNVGIRRRLAPLMENDPRKIRLMLSLLFSLPGSPFLYYGDEIGMGDDLDLPDRDGVRTPMQWDASDNAGFSTGASSALYAPPISDEIYGYASVNVAAQEADPGSLLNWVRQIIAVRSRYAAFGRGTVEWLDAADSAVLAFRLSHGETSVHVAINLADRPAECDLPAGFDAFTGGAVAGPTVLEGYEFRWVTAR